MQYYNTCMYMVDYNIIKKKIKQTFDSNQIQLLLLM